MWNLYGIPPTQHKAVHIPFPVYSCVNIQTFFHLLPQCEKDHKTGEFLDTLTPQAQQMVKAIGSCNIKVSDILHSEDRAVFTAIQEGLDKANEHATSQAQVVGIAVL